jgi:hypothetical protein
LIGTTPLSHHRPSRGRPHAVTRILRRTGKKYWLKKKSKPAGETGVGVFFAANNAVAAAEEVDDAFYNQNLRNDLPAVLDAMNASRKSIA